MTRPKKFLLALSVVVCMIIFQLYHTNKTNVFIRNFQDYVQSSNLIKVSLPNSAMTNGDPDQQNGASQEESGKDPEDGSSYENVLTTEAGVPLSYRPPAQSRATTLGKAMNVSTTLLRRLGIPPTRFKTLTSQNVRDLVFVTAASRNHFNESRDCVAGIQLFFPGRQILYFDIGLTEEQRKEIRGWCDVELREFVFEDYPPHVSNRYTYAFKPLIMQRALAEFGSIFWVDSSVRIKNNDWDAIYERLIDSDGFYMAKSTGIPTFAVTHPDMYNYLSTDLNYQKTASSGAAGALILHNTNVTYWNILHWWFLCSLDPACIAPTEQRFCGDWGKCVDKKSVQKSATCWAGCHRYDQSVVNTLAANAMRDQNHTYVQPGREERPVVVVREPTTWYTLRQCT